MEQIGIERTPSATPGTMVLRITGPLNLANVFRFQEEVRRPDGRGVIIDLAGVPYMDSAALGAILERFVHSQRTGDRFAVTGVSPKVRIIMEMTRIDSVLPLFPTVADAEASFGRAARA